MSTETDELLRRIEDLEQTRYDDRNDVPNLRRRVEARQPATGAAFQRVEQRSHLLKDQLDTITDQMVGHKLGEFALTRTFKGHVKDDKKGRRR